MLLLPFFHFDLLDEHDIGEFGIHDRLLVDVSTFVFVKLVDLIRLLFSHRTSLASSDELTGLWVFLLLHVVDEEGAILAG